MATSADLRSAQSERETWIRIAQDQELWIVEIKNYLRGELETLSQADCKRLLKIASQYELAEDGTLYRIEWRKRDPIQYCCWWFPRI